MAGPYYWVLGTGSWSDSAGHWATVSGGAPNAANIPTATDDVFFDAESSHPGHTNYTVTVDATANCKDLTFSDTAGGVPTLAGASELSVYGSVSLVAGMGFTFSSNWAFRGASGTTKTLTTNAVPLTCSVQIVGGATFILQLVDNLTISAAKAITLSSGSLDTTTNSRAVILTSTTHTITGNFTGTSSFYDFTRTGTAAKTDSLALAGNITVTHNLTINGNSTTNRLLVQSSTKGTARTITAANVSVTNADFQDITGAGVGSWDLSAIAGGSGDCGGNTGITFTPADDWYYHAAEAGANNTSTVGKWFTATNGGGSVATYPPLPQDTQKFDANSFDGAGITVTQDMPRIGSVDWTGATNTPTWTTSTVASVFGSITLISGMSLTASTQPYTFEGRGAYTLTSAGKTWAKNIESDSVSGSLTLQDALLTTGLLLTSSGTINANGQNVTIGYLSYSRDGSPTTSLGSGLWTITSRSAATGVVWNPPSGSTINSVTSNTLKFTESSANTKIINGLGKTYNNLWLAPGAGTGSYNIIGSNTFTGYFRDDGTEAHSILFTAATNNTAATWDISGSAGKLKTIGSIGDAASHTLTKSGGGIVSLDYLSISRSTAGPANTFHAGANSVNGGNNVNWIWGPPIAGVGAITAPFVEAGIGLESFLGNGAPAYAFSLLSTGRSGAWGDGALEFAFALRGETYHHGDAALGFTFSMFGENIRQFCPPVRLRGGR